MILIFGGAYQGKKEFALRSFDLRENDIEYAGDIDWVPGDKKIVAGLEDFVRLCAEGGVSAVEKLEEMGRAFDDKIVIITDISQGIVPMDKTERHWREENGRAMVFLASKAEEVYRVFCGMESRIK